MKKNKKCNINKSKGEFKIVKIAEKNSKPQKVCKDKCLKKGTVACNYNGKTRECTLIYSGYKGVSFSLYFFINDNIVLKFIFLL